jgi:hypothetical protein
MPDNAIVDGLAVHPGRFARTLKMKFTEPVNFSFSGFQWTDGPRPRPDGSILAPDYALLSFGQTVV